MEYGAFHVHCGSKILLSNERRAAHVKDFSIGIVYSSRPIPAGGMFQVKVLNRGLSMCIVSDLMAGKLYTNRFVDFV